MNWKLLIPPLPPESEYPKDFAVKIMGLDGLIMLIGLAVFVSPFLMAYYPDAYPNSVPGSQETTIHITLGALIATPAFFRVMVAYGSSWVEVCHFFLGLLVFSLPHIMKMEWDSRFATGHMIAGGAIMVLSIISGLITIAAVKKGIGPKHFGG